MAKNIGHAANKMQDYTTEDSFRDKIERTDAVASERDLKRQIVNTEFPENWYSIFARCRTIESIFEHARVGSA